MGYGARVQQESAHVHGGPVEGRRLSWPQYDGMSWSSQIEFGRDGICIYRSYDFDFDRLGPTLFCAKSVRCADFYIS